MNDIALAGLLITSPSAAYAELRERPRFLFPLIALIVASAALMLWYYSAVDFEWLKDHLFNGNSRFQSMPEADRARLLSRMSQKVMMSSGVISTAIALPIVLAIESGYYMLAGKIVNLQQSFMHWFSLVCWSGLPALMVSTAASMLMLLSHGSQFQVGPSELQLFSLNELLFHRAPNETGYGFFSAVNLMSLWTWGLCAIGVRTWSGRSWMFSTLFVLLPFVLVYGVWAGFAFRG